MTLPSMSADMPRPLRLVVLLAAGLVVAGCAGGRARSASPASVDAAPTLPSDVRGAVERAGLCPHFAGEISGDGSDRDRQVFAAMTRLRCDRLDRDLQRLRGRYPGNRDVRQALDAAAQAQAGAGPAIAAGNSRGTEDPC